MLVAQIAFVTLGPHTSISHCTHFGAAVPGRESDSEGRSHSYQFISPMTELNSVQRKGRHTSAARAASDAMQICVCMLTQVPRRVCPWQDPGGIAQAECVEGSA